MTNGGEDVTDPIEDIIGDYRAFAAQQRDRLLALGIDIARYELSHLAFRVPEWDQYVHVRTLQASSSRVPTATRIPCTSSSRTSPT